MLLKSALLVLLLQAAVTLSAPEKPVVHDIPHPPPPPVPAAAAAASAVAPLQQQQHHLDEAFFERCGPQGDFGWIKYRDSCYKYFEEPQYWYPAEQNCKNLGGNLVSVKDAGENSFVGKLTYCKNTWLGRYAVNADLTNQASNYRWTDGLISQYHEHNFISNPGLHHPLVSAFNLKWYNNVYHAKQHYVCKVKAPQRNYTCDCPTGWKQLHNYCYHMPSFTATYVESDFYCRGRGAYVASIHTADELRAMSLLDVDTIGCPTDTWTGLLKLNPCRRDYFTNTEICYQWSDRSGVFNGTNSNSPLRWAPGHPNPNPDLIHNCVILSERQIRTVPCYTRARFVCKKAVEPRNP